VEECSADSPGQGPLVKPVGRTSGLPVELRGVKVAYDAVVALESFDVTIAPHARVGIVGPSGCGKSTLLSVIAGLLEPAAGTVSVGNSTKARDRLAHCALMPQKDLLLPWRTTLDNACLPLENRGISRSKARQLTRPLFERFGLAGFEEKRPSQLSGGMRQRVAFLRTLMAEKDVLLLDEPFGALDSITRGQMQEWLAGALDQNLNPQTVLLVTHDVDEALWLCQRVVVLSTRPGRIVGEFDVSYPRYATRRETVTSPEFAALKEQALEALES
jgi:ABC-type nitrate/sulfonate/bicarbonate transport system ATPase subunit